MFDMSWSEILLIAVVAIIFIGPKELPVVLRTLGRLIAQARRLADEFRGHVDEMMRESELAELRQQVADLKRTSLDAEIRKTVDPDGSLQQSLNASYFPPKESEAVVPPHIDPTGPTPVQAPTPPVQAVVEAPTDPLPPLPQHPPVSP